VLGARERTDTLVRTVVLADRKPCQRAAEYPQKWALKIPQNGW
jgi:hypothetical protein